MTDVRETYRDITKRLIGSGISVTTMESATSGQIASLITDTPGASAIFRGAYVSYCNEEKIRLGVSAETIARFSVYSKETALEMAAVCRKDFGADIGIGVTGTMGNVDPANAAASVPGELFFAIETQNGARAYAETLPPMESRLSYKLEAAARIAEKLLQSLEELRYDLES